MIAGPRRVILFVLVLSALLGVWVFRPSGLPGPSWQKKACFLMDTYVSISVPGEAGAASAAIDAALDRLQEIDVKFNAWDPRSPLYAFNQQGVPVTDTEILRLVERGLRISRESDGAFDMTVAPLSELWGFYSKSPRLPSAADIGRTLKSVGYRHLRVRDGRLEKDADGVRIDLGGIAKGYAVSEAVRILKARGIRSALVDAGGDVYVIGRREGRLWKVGVRDPRGEGLAGYVSVEDAAVMGSGDYERFFIQDGRRYHHIFDPGTGYPTEGVASVTVISSDPVLAQPWAKIPFVLGPEKGLELLDRVPGLEAVVILSSGKKLYSKGLRHPLRAVQTRP